MKAALVTVNCTLAAAAMAGETAVFFKPSKSAAQFPLRERSALSCHVSFPMAEPQIDHLDLVWLLFLFGYTDAEKRPAPRALALAIPFICWQPISISVFSAE